MFGFVGWGEIYILYNIALIYASNNLIYAIETDLSIVVVCPKNYLMMREF